MNSFLHDLYLLVTRFGSWFDRHFAWFFTNGMKALRNEDRERFKA
jgi:hypothetical protein